MKKFFFKSAILLVLAITSLDVSAQQTDTIRKKQNPSDLKQRQTTFYSKKLSISQELATKVTEIQNDFKAGIVALNSDSTLPEDVKRAKIDKLVVEKVHKLQAILTKDQLNQLLPTSERDKVSGKSTSQKMN